MCTQEKRQKPRRGSGLRLIHTALLLHRHLKAQTPHRGRKPRLHLREQHRYPVTGPAFAVWIKQSAQTQAIDSKRPVSEAIPDEEAPRG